MPVAIDIVDPPDRRPVFVLAQPMHREEGFLLRIGLGPASLQQELMSVRRILQQIVPGIRLTRFDIGNLSPDRNQRITQTVEFTPRFALCGLNHQRVRYGK